MRVLVADDHFLFRQGLRAMLGDFAADLAIDEAGALDEAIDRAGRTPPDLVLLDLKMPGMEGVLGIGAMRRKIPSAPIVVLSASESSADVYEALAAGASGYLPKSASARVMLDALRLVLAGGIYVPRDLLTAAGEPQPSLAALRLTARQREVLSLIVNGLSNKEVASRLGASEGTIKAHVAAVMRALGVRNRVQLLLAAQRAGLAAP